MEGTGGEEGKGQKGEQGNGTEKPQCRAHSLVHEEQLGTREMSVGIPNIIVEAVPIGSHLIPLSILDPFYRCGNQV